MKHPLNTHRMSKGPMKTFENTLETPIIPKKHLASNALNAPNQKDLPKTQTVTQADTLSDIVTP